MVFSALGSTALKASDLTSGPSLTTHTLIVFKGKIATPV